jgi:iron complex outermembrane recepter protein
MAVVGPSASPAPLIVSSTAWVLGPHRPEARGAWTQPGVSARHPGHHLPASSDGRRVRSRTEMALNQTFKKWHSPVTWLSACVAASAALFHASAVQAQAQMLDDVTVVASRQVSLASRQILTSVDAMGAERLAGQQFAQSWEVLGLLPGVQLTEFRLGAESGKPSFRAFNGEGYINGVKLLIDGVPSHVNSGNLRFFDMVVPMDLESVEVIKGTNDPRHGLHNIGGNVQLFTRQGGSYSEGRVTVGSFGTREAQLVLGREGSGWSQNYALQHQYTEGYRDHSRAEKLAVSGKWTLRPSPSWTLGVTARLSQQDAEEAGYLTAAELAADRFQSAPRNANDHDDRAMQHLSVRVNHQPSDSLQWSSLLYVNSIDDDRFVTYTGYSGSSAPRQRRHWVEDHSGWISQVTWRLNERLTLEAGANLEQQANRYQRYRYAFASPTDFTSPVSTSNDERYSLDNVGAYVQGVWKPAAGWKVVPALRVDQFTGHVRYNATGKTASLKDHGWIPQPKLSVVHALTPQANVYANWGKTFQILTGSGSGAYPSTPPNSTDPSVNTGYELGTRWQWAPQAEARLAWWRQDATDEVANLPSAGVTQQLGATRREGVDLSASAVVGEHWKLWASQSWQQAKVRGGYALGSASVAGKEVFSTPRYIANAGLEYKGVPRWALGVQGRAQGSYFIDDLNAQGQHGGHVLFDASVRHAWSPGVTVDLQVKNLLNRRHAYVWWDNFFWPAGAYQPMFSPGAPRAVYLSVQVAL